MEAYFENLMAGERAAVLTTASVYLLLTGSYSILSCFALRRWPSTVGRLTFDGLARFGWSNSPSERTYRADVRYTYDVAGQTYEGKRLSPTVMIASTNARALLRWQMKGIERLENDGVRVFYKPTNPQKSYLIVPSLATIGTVAIVMFGGAALVYLAI